ncbi:bifunctional transcriptional activator/DNA repair enzyme AdaA [Edaphovirga cremea]|uniref:bifunctional transcriptional activator/DNA repair enzyme AdaA n=1 Tax=Edaphovirga cremea TaxID=2267246 RepID=UPI0039899F47
MLFDLPDDDTLYTALIARDPAYDGFAFVGVKSTGVFCRLTCAARKPKRENSRFFSSIAACLEAGFRPCKRCTPLALSGEKDPTVTQLIDALDREPEKRWSEDDLLRLDYDPSTVRRAFKRQFGITFLEMARLRRLGKGMDVLASGVKIIDAQIEASYESGSGFRAAIARHIGVNPSQARTHQFLKADWLDTPIGSMLAVADNYALHLLEFCDRKALPTELTRLKNVTGSDIIMGRTPLIDRVEQEMNGYFSGQLFEFTTPLAQHGSLFTQKVWDVLRSIPIGDVQSYSAIASMMGQSSATRAVARANGANQISIIIPCHRVIGADGSLTGYGGGLWRKRWLIEHERRMSLRQ